MDQALTLATEAQRLDEVPVGAVLVAGQTETDAGTLLASACNQPISSNDPTAHAEVLALRQGGSVLENYRLVDTVLYCTLEPCAMCAGAMVHARIKRLVYGAREPKAGVAERGFFAQPWLNHQVSVTPGVKAMESQKLLQDFFAGRRKPST